MNGLNHLSPLFFVGFEKTNIFISLKVVCPLFVFLNNFFILIDVVCSKKLCPSLAICMSGNKTISIKVNLERSELWKQSWENFYQVAQTNLEVNCSRGSYNYWTYQQTNKQTDRQSDIYRYLPSSLILSMNVWRQTSKNGILWEKINQTSIIST